jgi:hypothetical protein
VIYNSGVKLLTAIICIFVVGVFVFHLTEIAEIADFKKKPTDFKAPIYGLVGFSVTCLGAIGFGKPYSPFIFSFFGLIAMALIGRSYPGMYDWMDKMVLISTALVLVAEYVINVCRYGRWYSSYEDS